MHSDVVWPPCEAALQWAVVAGAAGQVPSGPVGEGTPALPVAASAGHQHLPHCPRQDHGRRHGLRPGVTRATPVNGTGLAAVCLLPYLLFEHFALHAFRAFHVELFVDAFLLL